MMVILPATAKGAKLGRKGLGYREEAGVSPQGTDIPSIGEIIKVFLHLTDLKALALMAGASLALIVFKVNLLWIVAATACLSLSLF